MEQFEPKDPSTSTARSREKQGHVAQICETPAAPFSSKGLMETKISMVWVEFDGDEGSESSSFSFDSLIAVEGESLKKSLKSIELL